MRLLTGLAVGALLVLSTAAAADVLVLDDGRRIEGTILEETPAEVKIKTNFGTLTFARSEVVEVIHAKTRDEIYREKLDACEVAEDFYRLGLWCEDKKLRKRAQRQYEKAVKLDSEHAGARTKLGFVRYKKEWVTPQERDRRQAADLAAEMKARGLVEHEGRWVTTEEKQKLDQGLHFHGGEWITREEWLERQGQAEFDGEVMARERALALRSARSFIEQVDPTATPHIGAEGVVIGAFPAHRVQEIDAGLKQARLWFDETFEVAPGLALFAGRLPEFYVFGLGADDAYRASADWAAKRSSYIPEGWTSAVKRSYGFTWLEPIPISSARQGPRGEVDVVGHCFHHMGHLMLGRAGHNGRLLPPWYEEGVASVAEHRAHGSNKVFCRSSLQSFEGTQAGTNRADFDEVVMRDGAWRDALRERLKRGEVPKFDQLARLGFGQLKMIDIATSMAIIEWLESRPGALYKFHLELRRSAPPVPARVIRAGHQRQQAYDFAFEEAVGMGFIEADAEWRRWFLNR